MQIFLLSSVALQLSACDRGLEIMSVEVIQLPYKMVYVAGIDDHLNMEGTILQTRIRDGRVFEDLFEEETRAFIRHDIDFSTPGEYEVRFYWGWDVPIDPENPRYAEGPRHIYTMTIKVIAP